MSALAIALFGALRRPFRRPARPATWHPERLALGGAVTITTRR
ncbi:hypothetical protein [Azospirillum halopraeferens]|nr:hypothetical protein [Azospirillum halopraeferens]